MRAPLSSRANRWNGGLCHKYPGRVVAPPPPSPPRAPHTNTPTAAHGWRPMTRWRCAVAGQRAIAGLRNPRFRSVTVHLSSKRAEFGGMGGNGGKWGGFWVLDGKTGNLEAETVDQAVWGGSPMSRGGVGDGAHDVRRYGAARAAWYPSETRAAGRAALSWGTRSDRRFWGGQ